jgi:chorismate lyase/3-hydroxybenzoate synthase
MLSRTMPTMITMPLSISPALARPRFSVRVNRMPMPAMSAPTAAIVGHESLHADSIETQLDETLANFDSLIATARQRRPTLPARFGPRSRLKVYVRDLAELDHVAALLEQRLAPEVPRILLHAQVCRRELRVEIDGVHDL